MDLATNEMMAPSVNANCQYSTRYCWEADKVKSLIRLRAELSPLFTGKRNASKYAWAVVERELNVPLPLSKIIKKWNNLLQEYKAIKMSEEPKRREWPFFTLMDVYFSEQVNDPSLRLFSSTKTLKETIDDSVFEDDPIIASAIAAATSGAYMDIEELIRRQKERANDKKFAADEYKFNDIKPMMANNKFNHNSDIVKLSKSVDDLSMQQHKIKEEIIRQREQEQQENIVKIKQHARQQQQRFQQQQQTQVQQHPHAHHVQHHATPPPNLHSLQQHHLHQQQQHHHQQQQREREQQQREQQLQQAQRREQQQREQQQQQREQSHALHHQPPSQTPPTTAQQIHLQTAQHQAQQQQLHLQQQHQQQREQQREQQQFTDPNTIDQYLLSWNNFHGNMCRGFHTLQKDEKMVDVTIAAGGKIFKAHKLVLSVCSPYFQQIFLENPSSHPILLMADVEASHMIGLLDFMYSGQVNVKYEDLPVFLKVAEAMKIKGLHTEKNMDDDSKEMNSNQDATESTECRFDRATHSVNITTGQGAYTGGQTQLQQQLEANMNGVGNSSTPIPVQSFSSFRDHIKSKATLAETFMKNLSRNNNNSSNSSNFNHLNNCTTNSNSSSSNNNNGNNNGNGTIVPEAVNAVVDNYAILHANSKKMLDTRKQQHKNWAKRKIQMYYNDELNEKRLKESIELQYGNSGGGGEQHDGNNNNNSSNINCGSSNSSETQEDTNLTAIATAAATHQQQQQVPQPPLHKNFKIRLLENHRSNSSEEEALNLVQNTTAPATLVAATKNDDRLQIDLEKKNNTEAEHSNSDSKKKSQQHAVYTQEDNDNNNVSNNNNNDDAAQLLRKKFISADDNNNNNEVNTDNNNNETNKNAALINAINKSLERKVQQKEEDDTNNNNNKNNNKNDSNNNNSNELDLTNATIVRNIATAEILCGLKSKVIKIKREREEEEGQQQQQQQQCRNLSEIKNAE